MEVCITVTIEEAMKKANVVNEGTRLDEAKTSNYKRDGYIIVGVDQ